MTVAAPLLDAKALAEAELCKPLVAHARRAVADLVQITTEGEEQIKEAWEAAKARYEELQRRRAGRRFW